MKRKGKKSFRGDSLQHSRQALGTASLAEEYAQRAASKLKAGNCESTLNLMISSYDQYSMSLTDLSWAGSQARDKASVVKKLESAESLVEATRKAFIKKCLR